jgi:hypothetical protein
VIGEELGFVAVLGVIVAFFWLTRRICVIGRQAIALDRVFAGLMTQGIGIWFGGQSFINMGVNLGLLPTKGLTLPLSYGGSGNCEASIVARGKQTTAAAHDPSGHHGGRHRRSIPGGGGARCPRLGRESWAPWAENNLCRQRHSMDRLAFSGLRGRVCGT